MISKVITGSSFSGVCPYVCADQTRAIVLYVEGVRGHDCKLMASDFEEQQALRPSLHKAVFHAILSFYPGEKIHDEKMAQIAREYLKKLGIIDTQVAITKHCDKEHPHVHVIANLVNNQGKTIKDNWIGLKGKKVAQQLTKQYGLKEAVTKNLDLIHLDRLNEKEANRYAVFKAISATKARCTDLNDLKNQLQKQGIETLFKYKGQTTELQGISFKIGEYKYKGSEVDRNFSIKNLQRTLEQQVKQTPRHSPFYANNTPGKVKNEVQYSKENSLINALTQPDTKYEQVPNQLLIRKRKKKSKSLHL
ncbi:relaxase/mobilization nuclease domain-containing protein [Segetibacter koreensis]|uniref:relaxase/mobilization nuclease domain-containing protein n=1 Tax=Segetibacter koreensis TaxID=398037 RepID=UPI00036A7A2E|nr:relaxase/mobilization nuclease domain-containing protein [Segetibacter koreensis]